MASELIVQTLKGPTSGANANKVIVPSGQTLTAPGHVIQVVNQNLTTGVDLSSSSFTEVFSLSITPSSSNSKILLMAYVSVRQVNTSAAGGYITISRAGTQLGGQEIYIPYADGDVYETPAIIRLDSPNTTSAVSYRVDTEVKTGIFRFFGENDSVHRHSTMVAMEIAG